MWGWITPLLTFVFSLFGYKKSVDPSTTQLADSNAHATDAAEEEAQNAATLNKALAARTAADSSVMRNTPGANEVHSDSHADVNNLPGETFRD